MKNYKLSPVVFLLVFLISCLNQSLNAQKQAGMPDPGFGTNGQVITPSPDNPGASTIKDFALQPDGKILVAGDILQAGIYRDGLARFHPNGEIDTSFGVNGFFIKTTNFHVRPVKMIVQPDGKILLGAIASPAGYGNFAFYRYLGDAQFNDWNNSKRRK